MVVVAVGLSIWLAWRRDAATFREESAARESAESAKWNAKLKAEIKMHTDLMVRSKINEAAAEARIQQASQTPSGRP